jgi:hypothetical protein
MLWYTPCQTNIRRVNMTLTEIVDLVTERIERGQSPFDIEEMLLDRGIPSAMIGVAFDRVVTRFRESAASLMREADQLEALRASVDDDKIA